MSKYFKNWHFWMAALLAISVFVNMIDSFKGETPNFSYFYVGVLQVWIISYLMRDVMASNDD